MSTILHLSFDYSERKNGPVTTAVGDLVQQTQNIANTKVIRLDRVRNPAKESTHTNDRGQLCVNTLSLPFGLFLSTCMKRGYNKIIEADKKELINLDSADVIHAHKLTYEGAIGYYLARELEIPLFISLRQTDFAVLKYRKDLIGFYKKVLIKSSKIFHVAPYMVDSIREIMGEEFFFQHINEKLVSLPNRVVRENTNYNISPRERLLLIVLRLEKRSAKRKNLKNLFYAMKIINDENLKLNIIGDGNYLEKIKHLTNKIGIAKQVNFLGAVKNSEMDKYYKEAEAFVMPSRGETFGLVYGESLLNGTPILYSQKTGFDGLFNNVGVAVKPSSPESIAEGIEDILENNLYYRENIKKLQQENAFRIFTPAYSREVYKKCLDAILPSKKVEYAEA